VEPVRFLAPVLFTGVRSAAASAPAHDMLVWEDAETLSKDDDWAEFTQSRIVRIRIPDHLIAVVVNVV